MQGSGINGAVRFALLVTYTLAFLGLGRLLTRWDRVKEAGPVFIALGAILVPVDFIALRTQVLDGGQISTDWLWLIGASTSGALYTLLAVRGYGRLYLVPALPAFLIAWAALGLVADLPIEWFGAWFMAIGAAAYVIGMRSERGAWRWLRAGAFTLAVPALLFSLIAAPFSESDNLIVPVSFAFAMLAIGAGVAIRREPAKLAMLSPLVGVTAMTSAWAFWGVSPVWWGAFAAITSAGYLLSAYSTHEDDAALWGSAAFASMALGVAGTHIAIAAVDRWPAAALPLVYGLALGLAIAATVAWRWSWRPAIALVPALLAAFTLAAVAAWSSLTAEWFFVFAVLALCGYLAIAHLDAAANGAVWGGLALLSGLIAVIGTHLVLAVSLADGVSLRVDDPARAALPCVYGATLMSAIAAYVRFRWRGALGLVPPLTAGFGASLTWAVAGMDAAWIGPWIAGVALGHLAIAEVDRAERNNWRRIAAASGLVSLAWAHIAAGGPESPLHAPLPVVYGLLTAGAAWDSARRRDDAQVVSPALLAGFGVALLWGFGLPYRWWAFPAQGVGLAMLLTWRWWRASNVAAFYGWSYALLFAAIPAVLSAQFHYDFPAFGAVSQYAAAVALLSAAILARGSVAKAIVAAPGPRALFVERQALARLSSLFLMAAAGSTNALLDVNAANRAWVYAGISIAAWLILVLLRRRTEAFGVLVPAATIASIIAASIAYESPGHETAVLALAALGPLVAFVFLMRWSLALLALAWAIPAAWAAWEWQGYAPELLPIAYALAGAGLLGGLWPIRKYALPATEEEVSVLGLSWGAWAAALVAALAVLASRDADLPAAENLATTGAWITLTMVIAAFAIAVTLEGLGLDLRAIWVPGTAGLLLAALFAIAMMEPSNIQAYTAPIGVYLIILGLTWGPSPPFIEPHVDAHELAVIAGALFLVVPPAEQSFQPNGGGYGLQLLAIGVTLLVTGLAVNGRWLVPIAVVTLTGVAGRLLTGGFVTVPYWALLAGAGTLLIGGGLLLLFEREAWDRFRQDARDWWFASSTPPPPLPPEPVE